MKRQHISALALMLAVALTIGIVTAFASPADTADSANGTIAAMDTSTSTDETSDAAPRAAVATYPKGYVSVSDASTASLEDADFQEWIVDEEYATVGWRTSCGDLIFEIVSDEEIDQAAAQSQTANLSDSSATQMFQITSSEPYAKVWIRNNGSTELVFTITEDSPDGSVVAGHCFRIPSGMSLSVYTSNKWPDGAYYVNFTSDQADMSGIVVFQTFPVDSQLCSTQ